MFWADNSKNCKVIFTDGLFFLKKIFYQMNQRGADRSTPRFCDMWNRVEHQKLNQVAAELPPGWVFGVQLGLRQTHALIKMKTIRRGKVPPAILLISSRLIQCLCLPKAELNTKNSTRRQLCCLLVEFLVFNSISHVIKNAAWPGSCRTGSYHGIITFQFKLDIISNTYWLKRC